MKRGGQRIHLGLESLLLRGGRRGAEPGVAAPQAVRLVDDELAGREVGADVPQRVAEPGGGQDAGEDGQEHGEGGRGQGRPGPGPVAAEVAQGEPHRDRRPASHGRGHRDAQRGEYQAADGGGDNAREQQHTGSVVQGGVPAAREREAAEAGREQGQAGPGAATSRPGWGRAPGQGRDHRHPGRRPGLPGGGGHGGDHRQQHGHGQRRPWQAERVDDMARRRLQVRYVREPGGEAEPGAGQRS